MAAPDAARRGLSAAHAQGLVAASCAVVLALLAAQVLLHGPIVDFDHDVSMWLSQRRSAGLSQFMLLVADAHGTAWLLLATALIAAWRWRRGDRAAPYTMLVVPTGMLVNVGLKYLVQRARPAWEDPLVELATYSFPSGHAAASTVFYGALCLLVFQRTQSRKWRAFAAGLAVFMVLLVWGSRLVLGAHYPADVIAGTCVGILCLLAWMRWVVRRRSR